MCSAYCVHTKPRERGSIVPDKEILKPTDESAGAAGRSDRRFFRTTKEMLLPAIVEQGVLIVEADSTIRFANKWLATLIGVPEELLEPGVHWSRVLDHVIEKSGQSASNRLQLENMSPPLRPGIQSTLDVVRPNGQRLCVNSCPLPDGAAIITYTETSHIGEYAREIASRDDEIYAAAVTKRRLLTNFEAMLENMEHGILLLDQSHVVDFANATYQKMWKFPSGFFDETRTYNDLIDYNNVSGLIVKSEVEQQQYIKERTTAVKVGTFPPMVMRRSDGSIIRCTGTPLPDGRRMLTYTDITEPERKEQEIQRHTEALTIIQNSIGHGLSWFDEDLKLRAWNSKLCELLDLPENHFEIGDHISVFFRYIAERGDYGEGDVDQLVRDRIDLARKFEPHQFERTTSEDKIIKIEGFPVDEGGFVTVYTDVTERRQSARRIEHMAHHDVLTGLPNRLHFSKILKQTRERANTEGTMSAVLCFDLDHFKDVNDTLGHAFGDILLQKVAERVQKEVSASDTLSRLGGDEFAIIQLDIKDHKDAADLAQRIVDTMARPFNLDNQEIAIGASCGISICAPDDSEDDADFPLRCADIALYSAKACGRGTHRLFKDEMVIELRERKQLEAELRVALAGNQFEIHYQPQVGAEDRSIVGVEALLRWHHPARGLVPPAQFVPLCEDTGLIREIGAYVLETACTELAPYRDLNLAVNLSAVQFRCKDLFETVRGVLAKTGFEAGRLELEITETALFLDFDDVLDVLGQFKAIGVAIAMDDFGTGYSSLSYLRKFPFDKLKIDRNFISDINHSSDSSAIVQAVINLGKSLGMRVNAEGVETNFQAHILRIQGCDELQGYYFGRPMPFNQLVARLELEAALPQEPKYDDVQMRPAQRS